MNNHMVTWQRARIPTWKAGLLTTAGCAVLTKITLSSIPTHISIACCLSDWAIKQIDRRRRAFIWVGADTVGWALVAWSRVYRPTDLGGLGIVDLRFFGFALRAGNAYARSKHSDPGPVF